MRCVPADRRCAMKMMRRHARVEPHIMVRCDGSRAVRTPQANLLNFRWPIACASLFRQDQHAVSFPMGDFPSAREASMWGNSEALRRRLLRFSCCERPLALLMHAVFCQLFALNHGCHGRCGHRQLSEVVRASMAGVAWPVWRIYRST